MEVLKTPAGKELVTYSCPRTAAVLIKFKDGGVLPQELSGIYTTPVLAKQAILIYLATNKDRQDNQVVKKEERKKFVKEMIEKKED